ncbi:xanthan lyase [Bacteroidia bacterium]|nr:xanthan lyase [Bacteroidia bacterium]
MSYFYNIQSIAKYESKLLLRSWFFRIFTILYIFILFIQNLTMLFGDRGGAEWALRAIASNIPYMNLASVNFGQAIIAIFLASDFMKRDHKMDTSEVFYVRPLSNAEYILGKIWGNLRVFLIFNLIVIAMSIVFTICSPSVSIDWPAYLVYFLLISIPTLIYIIGLSVFLMLLFRNQSLTFILLLGYIGLSIFYLKDKYFYIYDYLANYLPLVKSSIVGFTNWEALLTHRLIYLFAGFAFISMTIALFRRLPNSPRNNYPWIVFTVVSLLISGSFSYKYINDIQKEKEIRNLYININNQYVHTPKMVIDEYNIAVEQHPDIFNAEVKMKGITLETASVFTFCLNPGLSVQEVTGATGEVLSFKRDQQIILIDFGKEIATGDTIQFTVKYGGKISNAFCYLDIPDEDLQKKYGTNSFSSDKQYTFQTANYLMFTPETYWYPRPGTAYSNESSDWQQTYFSRYTLKVKPLPGLIPISQGEVTENADGTYSFAPEYPAQAISLLAGKYKQQSLVADGIQYNIRYFEGHDYYSNTLKAIQDTLPAFVREFKEGVERKYQLDYPFKRFSIVETPAQFCSYRHVWSKADENMQPEMFFIAEKGWSNNLFDIETGIKRQKRQSGRNSEMTNEEVQIQVVSNIFHQYTWFPQLYNFRFNIFSTEWPIANRIFESYLQAPKEEEEKDLMTIISEGGALTVFSMRTNGVTDYEKANMLMEKQNFKELLANAEHRDLLDCFVGLRAIQLFSPAEINLGTPLFRDSVFSILKRNTFRNIQFEYLIENLENISGTDIQSQIKDWDKPSLMPFYSISSPEISQFTNKGKEVYVVKIAVANESDYDGIIQLEIKENREQPIFNAKTNRKIAIPAHQCLQLVSLWEEAPKEIKINTLVSGNIPSVIFESLNNINREKRQTFDTEGDYIIPNPFQSRAGEIIIDNEDPLFSLSDPIIVGLLSKWLNVSDKENAFKYQGLSVWRPPLQWTSIVNPQHYGRNIRSAYAVKSGKGNKTATWKAPLPSPGNYEVYYYVFKDEQARNNNRSDLEYHFQIQNGKETESVALNVSKAGSGWEQIGVYYFSADTAIVTLTNEYKQRTVFADAVKFVKR